MNHTAKASYNLSLLPNIENFEFIAVTNDNKLLLTKVKKSKDGSHYFDEFKNTTGWMPISEKFRTESFFR